MTATEVPAPAATVTPPRPRAAALSPSRAGDFMTCPLLYRFRVLDRLPEAPSPAGARGTLVHAVLERLFDLPAAQRTLAQATRLLAVEWERLVAAEPEVVALFATGTAAEEPAPERPALSDWLAQAAALLARYFELEDPRQLEPAARELLVETVLESGLTLRGYVDRIDESPAGELRLVDYKSGSAPREWFEARAMFQLRFYALVLWRLRGRVPRVLQLLYLGSGEVLSYEPDEADLRATERKLAALWQAITKASQTGDWRPSPSKLCDWCDHQSRCPAFGGTPPPLPAHADPAASTFEAPSARSRADEI